MRRVARPTDDAESVFRSCASKVRVRADRQRIEGAAGLIASEAEAYVRAAEGGVLHSIPTHPSVSGIVSTTEMASLYTNHLASRRGVARATYDRLLVLPRNGTCPLCAARMVSTLDHYLPKSTHPAYAVTPINLVACCSDCNFLKDEHRPSGPADQFIHPYFDNVEADRVAPRRGPRGFAAGGCILGAGSVVLGYSTRGTGPLPVRDAATQQALRVTFRRGIVQHHVWAQRTLRRRWRLRGFAQTSRAATRAVGPTRPTDGRPHCTKRCHDRTGIAIGVSSSRVARESVASDGVRSLDGCFWHGCERHYQAPATNSGQWAARVERNRASHRDTDASLQAASCPSRKV